MKPLNLLALDKLVRPAVLGQGYELVDMEWKREPGGWVFRLYIDRPPGQGYISHDDCVNVSREVSALLDVNDVLPGTYQLEVSSPGLNRPLKTGPDFARFIGQRTKLRLRGEAALVTDGAAPRRNFTGTIDAIDGNTLHLTTDGAEKVQLPIDQLEKANLIYQF